MRRREIERLKNWNLEQRSGWRLTDVLFSLDAAPVGRDWIYNRRRREHTSYKTEMSAHILPAGISNTYTTMSWVTN